MSPREAQQGAPSALWAAANEPDEAAIRMLLRRQGIDLEAGQGTEAGTALCAAARLGHSSIAELLLRAGANVNAQRSDGVTPLYLAAGSRQAEAAWLLATLPSHLERPYPTSICNVGALERSGLDKAVEAAATFRAAWREPVRRTGSSAEAGAALSPADLLWLAECR